LGNIIMNHHDFKINKLQNKVTFLILLKLLLILIRIEEK
jgi:hypothetical protein